jgi:plasmid stability protein
MLLRGVPDAIKTELAQFAKEDGASLSQKAIEILRKGIAAEKGRPEKAEGIRLGHAEIGFC